MTEIIPNSRIKVCMRHLVPSENDVKILYSPEYKRAHYGNLMVCGSVWLCPVCSAKISERRKIELVQGVSNFDGGLALVTLTMRHNLSDKLAYSLTKLDQAYKLLTSGRWWQNFRKNWEIVGSVSNLEITWGDKNGWHPHKHILYFFKNQLDYQKLEQIRIELTTRYLELLAKVGGSGLDQIAVHVYDAKGQEELAAEYMAKWDKDPKEKPWGIEAELTKNIVKTGRMGSMSIWQILDWVMATGEYQPVKLIREYAEAIKGKRFLSFSRGLRSLLNIGSEKTDLELAKEQDKDAYELYLLSWQVWNIVKKQKKRGHLLDVADSGDSEQIRAFLGGLIREEYKYNEKEFLRFQFQDLANKVVKRKPLNHDKYLR